MAPLPLLPLARVRRQGPYALFGHSMGAWIVWEMLQEISRRGLPLPVRLFASGNR
jgi:surfactin synthase thioesterase subunit